MNLHYLKLDTTNVEFLTCLKLTGQKVKGFLSMPCDEKTITDFLEANKGNYSKREAEIISKLNLEASNNNKLEIQISSNIR